MLRKVTISFFRFSTNVCFTNPNSAISRISVNPVQVFFLFTDIYLFIILIVLIWGYINASSNVEMLFLCLYKQHNLKKLGFK